MSFLLKSLCLYTSCLPPGWQLPGRQWRGEGEREEGCVECVGGTRHPPHTIMCVETQDRPTDLSFRLYILGIPIHKVDHSIPGTSIPGKHEAVYKLKL